MTFVVIGALRVKKLYTAHINADNRCKQFGTTGQDRQNIGPNLVLNALSL